ncbi:MAG: hypothetical protein ACTSP4_02620 [Candidatus Hodarchaeales archaeon]
MIGFAGYLFFESIIYLLGITDLTTINLLRDLSVSCSTVSSILLVFTALIVQLGGEVVESPRNILIGVISSIVLIFIGIPYDGAKTSFDSSSDSFVVFVQAGDFALVAKIALLIIPVMMIMYAVFQYMRVRHSSTDPVLRNQLLRLSIGQCLIIVGIVYFVIFPLFRYPGHVSYKLVY